MGDGCERALEYPLKIAIISRSPRTSKSEVHAALNLKVGYGVQDLPYRLALSHRLDSC